MNNYPLDNILHVVSLGRILRNNEIERIIASVPKGKRGLSKELHFVVIFKMKIYFGSSVYLTGTGSEFESGRKS